MPTKRVDIKYVRQHADFEAVLTHYGVALQGNGPQRKALCPFHRESKGSFSANLERRIFQCFGCGAEGNVIDFVMQKDDVDARQAAITVADICQIPTAPPKATRGSRKSGRGPKGLRAAESEPDPAPATGDISGEDDDNAVVERPSENAPLGFELKLNPEHEYLRGRATSEAIATFGLGYCSRGMMKGRIAIPVHNVEGELVGYAGRWAEEEPPEDTARYLLPKKFHKQLELFNLHRLTRPTTDVILVESYWSVFRLHELGLPVVSPMGRSVSLEQIGLLLRHGATHVTVLFDGDDAGRTGTEKAVPELAKSFYVHAPAVPDGFKPHSTVEDQILKLVG